MPPSLAPVVCVFGTGSDVGKSWITTGLCRMLADAGVRVAPYKAQNLSNHAGVTPDGLELGRAQIVQAEACRLVPHVDMNPLLLKPNRQTGAQVVALGRVVQGEEARAWLASSVEARRARVLASLDRLRADHELVVAEGAGSCAEVNLRARDLVNFPVAHHANAPVILVADIDRGGVFGQVVGTLEVLPPEDRARVAGVIINRFRGERRLFDDGAAWLEARTGLPVLGVVPWTRAPRIESEDDLAPDVRVDPPPPRAEGLHAAVLRLPHLSNPTDLDALERHGVALHWLHDPRDLAPYDLVVIPGTKNTRNDLGWLRALGWDARLQAYEGRVIGLCGGYQLMGRVVADPHGVEGPPGESIGLGLLPASTEMDEEKTTRAVRGWLGELPVEGYEIHVGRTAVDGEPLLWLDGAGGRRPDGARAGNRMGTYVHGLFDAPGAVRALLGDLPGGAALPVLESHVAWRHRQLDLLADHLRASLDLGRLEALVGRSLAPRPGPAP